MDVKKLKNRIRDEETCVETAEFFRPIIMTRNIEDFAKRDYKKIFYKKLEKRKKHINQLKYILYYYIKYKNTIFLS